MPKPKNHTVIYKRSVYNDICFLCHCLYKGLRVKCKIRMVAAKVFDEILTFLASKKSSDFIIILFINELKNMK